ncbi:MAG: hypothetical protein U5K81_13015 [Trueperaceae bacterium]|nr:hypothetical protein [Trueperaceae bacterium]
MLISAALMVHAVRQAFLPVYLESLAFSGTRIGMVVVGVGSGITQPLSLAVVSDHVPRRMLGFALGFRMTGNRAAQLVAPVARRRAKPLFCTRPDVARPSVLGANRCVRAGGAGCAQERRRRRQPSRAKRKPMCPVLLSGVL